MSDSNSGNSVPGNPVPGNSVPGNPLVGNQLTGQRIGDFQLLRRLGSGGMAEVYAAKQLSLGRNVAIKLMRRELATDADYVRRFRREARSAARLSHPHIVTVLDVGVFDDRPYIVQELIEGQNLKERLDRDGRISADQVQAVLVCVASALLAASDAGIIHRDIKPENLMQSQEGLIKVADFGLARVTVGSQSSQAGITRGGLTLGTPRYMSPEQIQGKPVDVRSDLYSLGVTAYHLLTGKPPFDAEDAVALAVMHIHDTPPPIETAIETSADPELDEQVCSAVRRLMAKSPDERFQSPADLLHFLDTPVASVSATVLRSHRAGVTTQLQRAVSEVDHFRRRRRFRRAFAIIALAAVGFAGYAWSAGRPGTTLMQRLRPETVAKMASAQEQFLLAMRRDDEAGWRAVGSYFPAGVDLETDRYRIKSRLQLGRHLAETDRLPEAFEVLRQVAESETAQRSYRVIALATILDRLPSQLTADDRFVWDTQLKEQWEAFKKLSPPEDIQRIRSRLPAAIVGRLESS